MTAAPTATCRRALVAAGVIPPRRPRAVTAALIAGFLALAGCASSPGGAGISGGTQATTANVFTTRHQVSLGQVTAEVTALYSGHPDVASFSVQDVTYTTQTRKTVLRECTTQGSAAGSQDSETGQIVGSGVERGRRDVVQTSGMERCYVERAFHVLQGIANPMVHPQGDLCLLRYPHRLLAYRLAHRERHPRRDAGKVLAQDENGIAFPDLAKCRRLHRAAPQDLNHSGH